MTGDSFKSNGHAPPRGAGANDNAFGKGSPFSPRETDHVPNCSTPFGLGPEVFEAYAGDPDGVERIGRHVGLQWDSNPSHREQLAEAAARRAQSELHKREHQHDLTRWKEAKRRTRLVRRRAVGEPTLRDAQGRLKLDAKKAIVLALGVVVLALTEFFGAAFLVQISGWTFIDESWPRSALLTFPVVVSGYVQLRNLAKLLRGRRRRRFKLALFSAGAAVAVAGLLCLSVSLGDAHHPSAGLKPPQPLVPYAALTCLSMLGAAVSLLAVEGWLQEKVDACRRFVSESDPAHERACRKVAAAIGLVAEEQRRQIDAERALVRLTKDRAVWVDWAQAEVRRRQIERAEGRERDAERRRLLAAKRRAENDLNDFNK